MGNVKKSLGKLITKGSRHCTLQIRRVRVKAASASVCFLLKNVDTILCMDDSSRGLPAQTFTPESGRG